MLLVQEFLLHNSIGDLARQHGVYCSFAKDPYKWSCNYDMIEAHDGDPIVEECRGLVLTTPNHKSFASEAKIINGRPNYDHIVVGETAVMAFPFRRFYNHGQGAAANVNFDDPTTKVMSKVDGTMCCVYFDTHARAWCVATRSVPNADLPLDNFGDYTFRTLFDRAFKETMGEEFADYANEHLDKQTTYMFELTTPYNRIVCQYNDFRITLLGARDLRTLKEIDVLQTNGNEGEWMDLRGLPRCKAYSLKTSTDIITWVATLNPLDEDGEGVVVLDKHFNRVKIKNPAHGLLSKAKDKLGSSMRNCLELALLGKEDDVVAVLPPEIVARIMECKEGVRKLIKETDAAYIDIIKSFEVDIPTQKDFALALKADGAWQAPLFKRFAGKINSTRDYIDSCKKDGTWSSSFLDMVLELIEKQKNAATI
jgi:hypothetical protein